MSYEPKLLIRSEHLRNISDIITSDVFNKTNDEETREVAKFLSYVLDSDPIYFEEIELYFCQPEGTNFNKQVRYYLSVEEVEYKPIK